MKAESENNRFYATVMATDIDGYFSRRKQEENKATQYRNWFQEVVHIQVSDHRGEIMQAGRGGILGIFGNVIEAVRCSLHIQAIYPRESVPVRIGIHRGAFECKVGEVYGSTVLGQDPFQTKTIYARWSRLQSGHVRTDLVRPYLSSHHPELLN